MEQERTPPTRQTEENPEATHAEQEFVQQSEALPTAGATGNTSKGKSTAFSRVREEYEEPFLIIIVHGLITVFGIGILSFISWLIDISRISDTAKHVLHVIDEYLMIFALVILGIAFIIKIVTVVLSGQKGKDE